jgi:hypothetical protein
VTITDAHRTMGIAIVAGWALLFVFGLVLLARKRDAGRLYWGLLTALQVLLGLQLLAGLTQLALGGRPQLLHWMYGAVFPGAVLTVCHMLTRGLAKPPFHVFFTIGAFFVFALTSRSLMTGLGLG